MQLVPLPFAFTLFVGQRMGMAKADLLIASNANVGGPTTVSHTLTHTTSPTLTPHTRSHLAHRLRHSHLTPARTSLTASAHSAAGCGYGGVQGVEEPGGARHADGGAGVRRRDIRWWGGIDKENAVDP
jgi:hypothetical protein